MQNSKTKLTIAIALIACIAVGIIAFAAGTNVGSSNAAARFEAERNFSAMLNRSELEALQLIDGPIYVSGHHSPDSDSVCSAIAYARLLNALGYDAQPVVLDKINDETAFILEQAGVEVPPLLDDASACNMVLVDHSGDAHSAEGLADANIISIIDHHGAGTISTGNQLVYDARPLGSTATIVWIRYLNYGINLDSQTAKLLFGALLSDTSNLKADTTTTADLEAFTALGELAGITDPATYYQDMFKASISYTGMTDEEIFESDLKQYESAGRKFAIGCVNVYDEKNAVDMVKRMKSLLPAQRKALGVDMTFAQISIFHDDISITYLVPSDEAAAEAIETAFGDAAKFDGTAYILNPGISRRQVLVPALTDVLAMHPKE